MDLWLCKTIKAFHYNLGNSSLEFELGGKNWDKYDYIDYIDYIVPSSLIGNKQAWHFQS